MTRRNLMRFAAIFAVLLALPVAAGQSQDRGGEVLLDALDGIGYFNIGLMDKEVRPLWQGMHFWGEAATIRCVPSNRPMWTPQLAVRPPSALMMLPWMLPAS